MDETIRDLARHHGHENISDALVTDVKRKLSEVYIDDILDGAGTISPVVTETEIKYVDNGAL